MSSLTTVTNEASAETFRRYATRYEPARRDACLSWWESAAEDHQAHEPGAETAPEARADQESHHQFALLLDISHTGASIALDSIPHDSTGVWLRLEGEGTTPWTEAEVVGVTTTTRGPHLLRLAFRTSCDFETLRAAVCG